MNINEALICRRSVRSYSDDKLNSQELEEVNEKIKKLLVLDEKIRIKGIVVENGYDFQEKTMKGFIGDYGKVVAPHYIILFSEVKKGYKENLGYSFEELVLWLTTKGIGSCWIGGNFDSKEIKNNYIVDFGLEPIIIIAFGRPARGIDVYRKPNEYKRKNISELIINDKGQNNYKTDFSEIENEWLEILNIALLAPSAVNLQPWCFEINGEELNIFLNKGSFLTKLVTERWGHLDCGIILKHLVIKARIDGYKIDIFHEPKKINKFEYIATIKKILDNEA